MPTSKISRYNNVVFTRDGTKLVITIETDESKVDAQASKAGTSVVVGMTKRNLTLDGIKFFVSVVLCRSIGADNRTLEL